MPLIDAGDDGSPEPDVPAPTPDALEPTPATDAPSSVDLGPVRDAAAERTGQEEVRADGNNRADGARDVRAETGADGRAGTEDAREPDAPPHLDATMDSAPGIPDTRAPDLAIDSNNSPDSGINVAKLTGTTFGTGPAYSANPTATYDKSFDGDTTTFFDNAADSGGYAGLDVGGSAVVNFIRYWPREYYNDRMLGGVFQCSATSQTSGYVDLFVITEVPPLAWTTVELSAAQPCRYFRYLGPAKSYTNVAEIEFWTKTPSGTAANFGTPWYDFAWDQPTSASSEQTSSGKITDNGNDGDISTVFCPANGNFPVWYRVDLGDVYSILQTDLIVENIATAYQYQIDVSTDGAQWTTTASHSSGVSGGHSTLADNFQAQARYVMLTFTGATNNSWGCVREFMVWGELPWRERR